MKLGGSNPEGEKSREFKRELRDMISAITRTASDKPGSGSVSEEDENGVRIITLAGTNTGATMRGDLDDQIPCKALDVLTTYVNSNFQAVNNSIMMGSSYSTNDPGVHLDVSDNAFETPSQKKGKKLKNDRIGSKRDEKESESSD